MGTFSMVKDKKRFAVFWHERRRSRSLFRLSTGNDVSGPLFSPLFSLTFFSPSSTFLIEGVLGSKNLFSER